MLKDQAGAEVEEETHPDLQILFYLFIYFSHFAPLSHAEQQKKNKRRLMIPVIRWPDPFLWCQTPQDCY